MCALNGSTRREIGSDNIMIKLAIDLGSSVTKIYRVDSNNGIALFEPSCVAIQGEDERVCAIGKEAKRLLGKTVGDKDIVYPIHEGEIVDHTLAVKMLKEFIQRAELSAYVRRGETVFSVPCGIGYEQLMAYKALAADCGFKKAHFVEAPYLSVCGSGIALSEEHSVFTIDIGAGVTNIAVVSLGGMAAGFSIGVGGNAMDYSIAEIVEEMKGLKIGTLTSETIKNEIGSLGKNARGKTIAEGSSIQTCLPASVSVDASDIAACLRAYIDKVIEYAQLVLNRLSAEVAADIHRTGVLLSGGVMKMPYVKEYIEDALKMNATVADAPHFAVARGGGVVLRDKKLLSKIELLLEE